MIMPANENARALYVHRTNLTVQRHESRSEESCECMNEHSEFVGVANFLST